MTQTLEVREGTATWRKEAARVEEIVGEGFDVKKFVENFDVLAESQGGVERLRALILDMAIRGRLSQLAITEEFVAESGFAGEAPPFGLPADWTWTTIGSVCIDSFYGPRFAKNEYVSSGGIPTIRTTDMTDRGQIVLQAAPQVRVPREKLKLYEVRSGDLLVTRTGSIGIMAVFRGEYEAIPSAYLIRFRFSASAVAEYLYIYLKSPFGQNLLGIGTTRVAQPNVNATAIRAMPLALPPLEEQERIVAKVDQLMTLCDELEERQTTKREVGTRLTKSALEALTTAEGSGQFDAAWKRVVENFDVLLETSTSLESLRQTVIDACVAGRVAGSGRQSASVPLGDIVIESRYGTSRKCDRDASLVPVLRIPNVVRGTLDLQDLKYTRFPPNELADLRLRRGDILVVRSNGSRDLVGRACVVDSRADGFAFAGYLIRLRLRPAAALPEWIQLALQSSSLRRAVEGPARTTSGVHNVNTKELLALAVPLPPLDQQASALRAATKLLTLCDELQAALRRAEDRASRLLEAVIHELAT